MVEVIELPLWSVMYTADFLYVQVDRAKSKAFHNSDYIWALMASKSTTTEYSIVVIQLGPWQRSLEARSDTKVWNLWTWFADRTKPKEEPRASDTSLYSESALQARSITANNLSCSGYENRFPKCHQLKKPALPPWNWHTVSIGYCKE